MATEGRDRCNFKLHRPIPFLSGRVDCQPDPAKKWTPYDFEATEVERQSNPRGTGNQVLQDLKQDFGLTARESISLQAVHSLGCARHNYVQSNKYVWFGSATDSTIGPEGTVKGLLSNIYYKYLNGEMYKRAGNGIGSRLERSYWVGDQLGRPVGGTGLVTGTLARLLF